MNFLEEIINIHLIDGNFINFFILIAIYCFTPADGVNRFSIMTKIFYVSRKNFKF